MIDLANSISASESVSSDEDATPSKQKLMRRMKITRSNRYNCAKRLESQLNAQAAATHLLSLAAILGSVMALVYEGVAAAEVLRTYAIFVIGIALTGWFVSLRPDPHSVSKRSITAHRCAREISHVNRELEAEKIETSEASRRYEDIISRYEDNHDPCDYGFTCWSLRAEPSLRLPTKNWMTGALPYHFQVWLPYIWAVVGVGLTGASWAMLFYFGNANG